MNRYYPEYIQPELENRRVLLAKQEAEAVAKEIGAMEDKANRFNEGKPQLSYMLDAPKAMTGLARVFEAGAKKYSRDNWKRGLDQNELVDSLMRHLIKVKNGQLIDDGEGGTGCNHWNLVLWNALVLAEQFNGEE